MHQRNLQILATEIYKVKNELAPGIMKDIFHFVEKHYNLKNNSTLKRRCNDLVHLGTQIISSLAPKIWELVPNAIKKARCHWNCSKKKLSFGKLINVLVGFGYPVFYFSLALIWH